MASFIYWDEERQIHLPVFSDTEERISPFYILNSPVSNQAAGYSSMLRDLNDCISAIQYLRTIIEVPTIPRVVKESLLFSSIVKYAKCYTTGEGRRLQLNRDTIFRGCEQTLPDFHDRVMEIRHQFLAHAGNSVHESRAMLVVLSADPAVRNIERILFAGFSLSDENLNLDSYLILFNHVTVFIRNRLARIKTHLDQEIEEIGIDSLYEESTLVSIEELRPFEVNQFE